VRKTKEDVFGRNKEVFLNGAAVKNRKKRNLARDVAIYLCGEMTGETSVALGRRFDISGTGIAARHDQIVKKLKTARKLKGRENRIRRKILNI
jgi:chromosomal replication initiation ATPase DnaA